MAPRQGNRAEIRWLPAMAYMAVSVPDQECHFFSLKMPGCRDWLCETRGRPWSPTLSSNMVLISS